MTASIVIPIIVACALLVLVVCFVVGIAKESRQEKERWQKIASTLRCPRCRFPYDRWDGVSWGIDADPPESIAFDHGIVLKCPHCSADGYVAQDGHAFRVFSSLEEVAIK